MKKIHQVIDIERDLRGAVEREDHTLLHRTYWGQREFLLLEQFIPPEVIEACLNEIEQLSGDVHRNYVPGTSREEASASAASGKRPRQSWRCIGLQRFARFSADWSTRRCSYVRKTTLIHVPCITTRSLATTSAFTTIRRTTRAPGTRD